MEWLKAELQNWADWLAYDASIGPEHPQCRSIERNYQPEAGDTLEEAREPGQAIPNISAAERLNAIIEEKAGLSILEKRCLAVRWGGLPAVFRYYRISDYVLRRSADNAEAVLARYLENARERTGT